MRGWLQLTIFASHATGSWIGLWLIPSPWGLSDSSEQFVFLSGLTLGSVFARKAARDGWQAGAVDLLARTLRLYRTHLTVFVCYGALVCVAGLTLLPGEVQRMGWGDIVSHPWATLPAVLLLVQQPAFMGILPLFVWCMLLLPGFAALQARVGDRALLLPLAGYALAWVQLCAAPQWDWQRPIGFNPLAWQLVFLLGAWLGRRALLHGQALPFARWARAVTPAAVVVLAAGLALQLHWHGFLAGLGLPASAWLADKKDLAPGRLLHALAVAWLVAALVPREAGWMHRSAASWIAAIGRHSLSVFCVGLLASWTASALFRLAPSLWVLDPLIIAAGCAGLGVFAWWREQRRGSARAVLATRAS